MASLLNTPAIVARLTNYGESDRICLFLTRDHGKLSALARGARQSRRRFGAALSLFIVGRATLRGHPQRDLYALEQFDSVTDFASTISDDLQAMTLASYMTELTREMWPMGAHEPELFDLLVAGLSQVSQHGYSPAMRSMFEIQILKVVGLWPADEHLIGMVDSDLAALARKLLRAQSFNQLHSLSLLDELQSGYGAHRPNHATLDVETIE